MFAKSLKAAVANSGWYYTAGGFEDEGQAGEALSLLLGAEFLVAAGLGSSMPGFDSANRWLGNGRTDYINTPPDRDNKHDAKVGCAILFLYYLKVQLGFSVLQIIQAGAPRLADVYRNLTGRQDDPFLRFKKILDRAFPDRSTITAGNLDNPYPLPNPPVDFDFVADAADSRIEIFPRGNDGHVWHLYQTEPNGDWSDWEDLSTYRPLPGGTPLTASNQPATGSAADGRIEIFARGTDNHVWHLYQTEPNGDWSNWEDLSTYRPLPGGPPLTASNQPATGSAADGRIEIFARGTDNHVWRLYQTEPNGDWSGWQDLTVYRPLPGGALLKVADQPTAVSAADGRIEIFVAGLDGHVWHLYQTAPNGDWSDWEDLSAYRPMRSGNLVTIAGHLAAATAADGRIEIFARGTDNHVWHLYQTEPNGDWSNWEDLSTYRPLPGGTPLTASNQPAAGSAADERIEIFARGTDNHVWRLYQTEPNGDWSGWQDLTVYRPVPGGALLKVADQPTAVSAADGRIEIFVAGLDGHVWHLYQTAPNGDWSDWEDLSTYRPGFPGF